MKKLLSITIMLLSLAPNFVHADGGMVPPTHSWIYETGQKAAIVYQDKTETLVLSTSFQGDAKDFGYIVPTPSQPEVSKVSDDIFQNLENMTLSYDGVRPLTASGTASQNALEKSDVQIVEEKKVGIFDVKVLSATDSTALYTWLNENSFSYPQDKKYILDDYIQNKWFFCVAKISAEAITPSVETQLRQGQLAPLKLVFSTDNIVYPLKISSVTDESLISNFRAVNSSKTISSTSSSTPQPEVAPYPYSNTPITLYIFADHKKEITGFNTEYASWIKSAEIEKLAKDDQGNSWVSVKERKMYLTKLNRYMTTKDMTNDLFPDNAPNNTNVGAPNWWETDVFYISVICVFLFFIIAFYVSSYWQFTSQSVTCRKICWILQIIALVITAIPLIIGLIYYSSLTLLSFGFPMSGSEGSTMLLYIPMSLMILQPISMIIIMLAEKYVQKKLVR